MNRRFVPLLVGVLAVVLSAVALASPGPVAVAAEPSAAPARAAASVSGRVTDAAGRPVFGVAVTLWQVDPYRLATAHASTDRDGTYRIDDVASGQYQVHVDGAGSSLTKEWWPDAQLQADARTFAVAEFQPRTGIDVALDPTATLSGRVVSATTGAGVAGARVSVVGTAPGRGGSNSDSETDRDVARVVAGTDGTFAAAGLQGGPYAVGAYDPTGELVATWEDSRPDVTAPVPRSGSTTGVEVVMDDAARVVGVAVDDDDRPIPGVRVRVYRDSTYWEATSGSTGAFDVGGVLPGDVKVELAGYPVIGEWWRDAPTREAATPVRATTAEDASLRAVLTLRSSVENAVVSGTVRDQLGRPVVGAEVRTSEVYYARSDLTDDEGRYELTGLRPGAYHVHASHPDHFYADSQEVVVAQGERATRDFTLTRGAVITGRLVDRAGRPVEGVGLYASDDGLGSGYSAADGSFTIRPVAAGSWAIRVGPGYTTVTSYWGTTGQTASTAQRVTVSGTDVVDIGTVVARTPARVTGRITDTEGRPLARRSASLTALDDEVFMTSYVDGFTGSDGTYRLDGITPGRFRLTLWCGQLHPFQSVPAVAWSGDVVLSEGQERRQDLVVALSAADETSRTRSCELVGAGLPRVVGRARTGALLAVRVPGVSPSPARVSVRWLVDGRRTGHTSRSLRVPRAWRGHHVRVRVVATRPDYQPLVLTSRRVRIR